jgi:hypothetical protein
LPFVFLNDLRVEVRIPRFQEMLADGFDESLNLVQLTSIGTVLRRQLDQIKPELCLLLCRVDMV